MALITIPGREDREPPSSERLARKTQVVKVSQVRTYQIQAARAADVRPLTLEAADDDVAEIELEGGIRLWTSVQRLREEFPPTAARGKKSEAFILPAGLPLEAPSRGFFGSWLFKTLRIIKVDVPGEAAHLIAEKVENLLKDGPGLYRCASEQFALEPLSRPPEALANSNPLLLFIHGTASSTQGSFGGLWETQQATLRKSLFEPYAGNILAFEHRTLSESPAQNALEIARLLPKSARVHLVTHSRGGLVGELLCRSQMAGGRKAFDVDDLELFRRLNREADLKTLADLNRELASKQFRVERFVRVACPARGTTLASGRLDKYFSIFINLLEQIPGLKDNPVYDVVTELLLAVIKKRTDPRELPGLEAMMPESPLIALLNRPAVRAAADLRVIAGDIEGAGIWDKLKVLATDLFYLDDHDLVVNTAAMFGGTERVGRSGFFFCRGPEVNHFSYFRNTTSAQKLVDGLTRGEGEDGFTAFSVEEAKEVGRIYRGLTDTARPVVFILPGMMGSHLAVRKDRGWIDLADLAVGGLGKLGVDATGIQPEALVASAYSALIQYLSQSHNVVPFPYDWRRSMREEARRLGQVINAKLDEVKAANQPVRILAHSMGGLLARAMVMERPDVWKRLCQHPGGRLLMLGTPNRGSFVIPRLLLGRERLMRQLALLDLKHTQQQLLKIVSQFPGLLEMLPSTDDHEFFSQRKWQELFKADGQAESRWVLPDPKRLSAARDFCRALDALPVETGRMLYVAGSAPATPMEVTVDSSAQGNQGITFLASSQGDGRVLWASGILPGLKAWYVPAEHGDLADYQPAFSGFLDLLQSGDTTRLPTSAPSVRGLPERFALPAEDRVLYPDQADLVAAALGSRRRMSKPKTKSQVHVNVTHGNLGYSRYVVAVGHYEGDTIISAEDHLDRVLNGRLRQRHRLGIYPGAEGTYELFLNPNGKPDGALIIGLGQVGKLTPGGLTNAVTRGLLSYAAACTEATDSQSKEPRSANLSTLLIGTGAGGVALADSVTAVLRAVDLACQSLEKTERASGVSIDHLEFIELYEDRAIQAARALQIAIAEPSLKERFVIDPYITNVAGGRRRATYEETPGWWQRMQVTEEKGGSLRFTALTERARAEVFLQPTQRALVDQFVEQAIGKTDANDQVAVTLFNLLLPNPLKDHAPERRDLVLVLDAGAARYPWELMQERSSRQADAPGASELTTKPLAVQAGLIRQLTSDTFRENARGTLAPNVLVIGDPASSFPALPQAEREAREVAQTLRGHGYVVTEIVRQTSDTILNALYARDYRILHLAGHGVYEYGESAQKVTGMVLGDNAFLTPIEMNQMRVVPDLVFINCCHLGRIEEKNTALWGHRSNLAANVSTQLIGMGVRAVIAAGWAVNDEAAQTFATEFYNALFTGQPFGKAVQQARCVTYENHPSVNTWGAYQCYGDHDFTLLQERRPDGDSSRIKYSAPAELLAELENDAEDATTASAARVEQLRKQLREIVKEMPQTWIQSGSVQGALGRAFGEVDCFEEAIEHYQAAIVAEKAQYPVRAIEQLSNLQARWAAQKRPRGAARILKEAKQRLLLLNSLGETAERMGLLGSVCKRQAVMARNALQKKKALQDMAGYYGNAQKILRERGGKPDLYSELNLLVAQVLLHHIDLRNPLPSGLAKQLEEIETVASRQNQIEPSFWGEVAPAECLLVRHLASGSLDKQKDEILKRYQQAQRRGASSREFRSVLENLDFVSNILESARKRQRRKAQQIKALKAIRDRLDTSAL